MTTVGTAAPVLPTTPPAASEPDEFSKAFDLHISELEAKGTAPAAPLELDPKPAASETAPAPDQPSEAAPPVEQPAAGADQPASDDPSAAAQPAAPAQPAEKPQTASDAELMERFARLAAAELARQPAPQAAQPAQQPQQPQQPPTYTPDEKSVVESYLQDYPDVAKGEALVRRAEYQHLVSHIFDGIMQYLGPLAQQMQGITSHLQYNELKTSIPEYSDELVDKVSNWAATQPAYLQAAYKQVIEHGTPEDVRDLVTRFQRETGQATKPMTSEPAKPASAELPAPAKQAAAKLAPVSTKRSSTPTTGGPEPEDFDAAFALFASKGTTI